MRAAADYLTSLSLSVLVPAVGDLTKFSQVKEHYRTHYEHARCLFTADSRPRRVCELYERAAATPALHVIRGTADDGSSPRRLYLCMPVWGDDASRTRNNVDLDIETRRPASLVTGQDVRDSGGEELLILPSPEEKMHALSLEYPAVVVPIDTSESSFNRLSSTRRSFIHVDFLIKRKKHHKRRNTISDGNSKEIAEALTSRKKSGTLVKTEALIHSSCQTDDDLLQAPATTTKSGGRSSGSGISKRRTEESPSSGELSSSSSTTTETNVNTKPEKRLSFYEAMNLSRLGRDWKFLKKSNKSKEADSGSHGAAKNEASRAAESGTSTGGSEKKKRSSSLLPISTNSAAMTVAVKMRETSARTTVKGVEDGQSSSGNWSASSSTRASVDSDQQQSSGPSPDMIPHSHSESSLGRDSLFSDNTHHSTDGRSHDGTAAGYTSDASVALTATTIASSWKQPGPLTARPNLNSTSTDQESQSGTITPEACHSDSKSSSSPGTRKISVGSDPFTNPIDDGDSSVYSVDTDGYYTSMHTDSGLKHGLAKFPGDQNGGLAASGDRGSQTSIDTIGNLSLNSFLSQNANDTGTDNCSIASTLTQRSRAPPLPPPRVSSARTLSPIPSQKESSPPVSAGDISESDCEVGERLRRKTSIGSFRYPSICAVSPEPSDEDSCRLDAEKQASRQSSPLSEPSPPRAPAASEPSKTSSSSGPTAEAKCTNAGKDADDPSARLNMYGVQSARNMAFLNAVVSRSGAAVTPQPQPVLGSFSSAESDQLQGTLPSNLEKGDLDVTVRTVLRNNEAKQSPLSAPVQERAKNSEPGASPSVQCSSSAGIPDSDSREQTQPVATSTNSQVACSSKQGSASPTSACTPFYLNRPSSLMSKTRSPFLSYLSKNSSPPKTPTMPSPPSPAKSAGRDMNTKQLTLSSPNSSAQDRPQSSPEPSSPQSSSSQTSPQTTPPAVPPPPPPLTYSSRVLEQGSARQPSAISEANSVFAQAPPYSRAGARVTLDSEGKVIYSSNSLGRHRDGYTVGYQLQKVPSGRTGLAEKCMTLPASMPPAPGLNQRAYVRLDPSGKVETYTSSTIPRTRYSVSGPTVSPDKRPLLQYRDGRFTLSSPTNNTPMPSTRPQQPLSGRSTPQSTAPGYFQSGTMSGRSTPQPGMSGYLTSQSSGRTTPVQRPASISTPYSNRPSGASTPVSDHNSSGRVTPLHHFSPISVPSCTSPGRRTPLQPSPREPVGARWVSGLPPSPPKSSTMSPNMAQHPPPSHIVQAPVPRLQHSGRTTPVHQYPSPSDGHIPHLHNGSPSVSSPVTSWSPGQMPPVSRSSVRSSTPIMHYSPQAHQHENSAAYAAVGRQVPAQAYGQSSRDEQLVNGRLTPMDTSRHNPANQYRHPENTNVTQAVHDHSNENMARPQYPSYIPRAPYQPSQSLIRGPLGQQISMMGAARGVDPRGSIPNHVPHAANGIHENRTYRQGGPLPQGYPTSPSRQSPVPRSPLSSTRLLAPDHSRGEHVPPLQKPISLAAYGQYPQGPTQQNHSTQNFRQMQNSVVPGHLGLRTAADNQRQMSPGVYIPSSLQNSYHADLPMPGAMEPPYGLRDLRKEGSPTALSSTSLSSSGSEKSPDSSSSTSITRELAPRRPMSTEDLFAAIHSSKKKHGIRTEADLAQSPLSSRSSSPLVVTSRPGTPSRGGLAETGFLSPRGARDRRSWSGDVAAARVCSPLERRSLANDRLGPAKPTSLLDFKKLLLQTKTSSSQNNVAKKSAVELLRPGSGGRRAAAENTVHSLPTSPVNTPSPVESPSSGGGGQAAWTSTVPLKRGGRSRSSLQHRYDLMYPPILEDCQEEGGEGSRATITASSKADGDVGVTSGSVQTHSPPSSTWV
ncbi:hypothetical protein V5799_033302 [Amblyomma americanum]|uniref:Uncharacterized protein n=1 Tax=Amblyomma americanum TaxID=6943 RepID=A0AAQ4DNP9_AMBAM